MKEVLIVNDSNPLSRKLTAGFCSSFFCRLKGLMFRTKIPYDWGLLLVQPSESRIDSSIHMITVNFDLGIVWINMAGEVVDFAIAKKWIGIKIPKKPAKYILEVDPAWLDEFKIGDKISFVDL